MSARARWFAVRLATVAACLGVAHADAPPAKTKSFPGARGKSSSSDALASCDRQVAAAPQKLELYGCYYSAARKHNAFKEAFARLEALRLRDPDNPGIVNTLGNLAAERNQPRTPELFREAARAFAARKHHVGAMYAHVNLARFFRRQMRLDDALAALDSATLHARAARSRWLPVSVRVERAKISLVKGDDLAGAHHALRELALELSDKAPLLLHIDVAESSAVAAMQLGRFEEASVHWRRMLALVEQRRSPYAQAIALSSIVDNELARRAPSAAARRDDLRQMIDRTIALSRRSGNRRVEAHAHRWLGDLLLHDQLGAARAAYQTCQQLAKRRGLLDTRAACLLGEAISWAAEEPTRIPSLMSEALRIVTRRDDWRLAVRYAAAVAAIAHRRADNAGAAQAGRRWIAAVERLRNTQPDGHARSRILAARSTAYYFTAGVLLGGAEPDIAQAFGTLERLRARDLLAAMDRAHATSRIAGAHPGHAERRRVVRQIIALQRRILARGIKRDEVRGALQRLAALESAETRLREQIANADARWWLLWRTQYAELARVRAQLSADEAMLVYQLAPERDFYGNFAGGSWVIVLTRAGAHRVALGDGHAIERELALYGGMLGRRDVAEKMASAAVYDRVARAALAQLPPTIDKLIVVPDGMLHRLSLGGLRPAANQPPLVMRYQISAVPSATMWMRWKERGLSPTRRPGLALADPELTKAPAAEQPTVRRDRQWALAYGNQLGQLPFAREEGEAFARFLGAGSRTRFGAEASEAALKSVTLTDYSIVHFAAHAVVDDEHPQRSAVLLSPGAAEQDGLLQIREIVDLELQGKVVVLSACRSAAGELLRGSGVSSLARAFFIAGAHAVVGSLWNLRDDEAARLFREFYRQLSQGQTLRQALQRAQQHMVRAGYPVAAWAGVVLLGDGDIAPLGRGRLFPWSPFSGLLWLVVALVALGVLVAARKTRAR